MTQSSATGRFSLYSANYEKYRPQYPAAILPWLQGVTGLPPGAAVADIGSGTGLFTKLLLQGGYTVQAVEPNAAMRSLAEGALQGYPHFQSINGTAEATTLQSHSLDLVTAAQAFHWFSLEPVGREFRRILKHGGWCLLAWNILRHNTPFLAAYNALKEHYAQDLRHTHRADAGALRAFFAPAPVITHELYHSQPLAAPELEGYLQSFSTVPLPGNPAHASMMQDLQELFARYQQAGQVTMEYETRLYLCQPDFG